MVTCEGFDHAILPMPAFTEFAVQKKPDRLSTPISADQEHDLTSPVKSSLG